MHELTLDLVWLVCVQFMWKSKKVVLTRWSTDAVLESCSQGTFILDQLRDDLRIFGRETSVTIKTINGEFKSPSKAVDGIQVSGINNDKNQRVPLQRTFARAELPVNNDGITKPGQLKQWKYLEPVANQANLEENISVGLLIGPNFTKLLEPIEILQSRGVTVPNLKGSYDSRYIKLIVYFLIIDTNCCKSYLYY